MHALCVCVRVNSRRDRERGDHKERSCFVRETDKSGNKPPNKTCRKVFCFPTKHTHVAKLVHQYK